MKQHMKPNLELILNKQLDKIKTKINHNLKSLSFHQIPMIASQPFRVFHEQKHLYR